MSIDDTHCELQLTVPACGACPSDPNSKDCSNIDGANHVECRGGDCYGESSLTMPHLSADSQSTRVSAATRSALTASHAARLLDADRAEG